MPPREASEAPKMRVVIAPGPDSAASSSSFSAHAFSAPHPRTGKDTQYLLHRRRTGGDKGDKARACTSSSVVVSLLEASRFAPSHGSWFYGCGDGDDSEAVCSDAGVLLLAEVDPLFVALPALDSARALTSEQRRKRGHAAGGDSAAAEAASNGGDRGRFVDAEAAVCGGERGDDAAERRAAAALPLLLALAGGREDVGGEGTPPGGGADAPSSPSSSPPGCSPLSPPCPRSKARADLLRAAGEALSSVCEVRVVGGDSYFRLCAERTSAWLRLKARKAAAALKETGGPAFAGLEGEALEAAGGALIAEWLPREWSERMGWPCPGSAGSNSDARPPSASAAAAAAAAVSNAAAPTPSWAASSAEHASAGPFTRDPNLPSEAETFTQKEERYQAASEFAKKMKLDAAAAAREKAKQARQDAKALVAKKEASTMKSLSGFFVVKKKN